RGEACICFQLPHFPLTSTPFLQIPASGETAYKAPLFPAMPIIRPAVDKPPILVPFAFSGLISSPEVITLHPEKNKADNKNNTFQILTDRACVVHFCSMYYVF